MRRKKWVGQPSNYIKYSGTQGIENMRISLLPWKFLFGFYLIVCMVMGRRDTRIAEN